jgi:hypothetical protein
MRAFLPGMTLPVQTFLAPLGGHGATQQPVTSPRTRHKSSSATASERSVRLIIRPENGSHQQVRRFRPFHLEPHGFDPIPLNGRLPSFSFSGFGIFLALAAAQAMHPGLELRLNDLQRYAGTKHFKYATFPMVNRGLITTFRTSIKGDPIFKALLLNSAGKFAFDPNIPVNIDDPLIATPRGKLVPFSTRPRSIAIVPNPQNKYFWPQKLTYVKYQRILRDIRANMPPV